MAKKIEDLIGDFWFDVDKYLKERCSTLTSNDLYELYATYLVGSKKYRGQSEGLTGFSEFIVFRTVYHCLEKGGFSFKPERKNLRDKRVYDKPAYEPISLFVDHRKNVAIGQSIRDKELRVKPDIGWYVNHEMRSAWEITTFLGKVGGGEKQIKDIVEKYKSVHEHIQAFNIMYVIFNQPSENDSQVLKNQSKEHAWFHYTILQDGNKPFESEVKRLIHWS